MNVIETERRQHAFEAVQRLDVRETDALICVGGDGTMSEVVQVILVMRSHHSWNLCLTLYY